jgi:stage III sporulation protein AD
MEIMQYVALALVAALIAVFLRQTQSPLYAMLVGVLAGTILFVAVLSKIAYIINILEELAHRAQVNQFYLATIMKIIGIAYIAEFGAQVCRDAGETAIASRVEFAAKVLVMVLAIPILVAILETIIRLLP